MDARTKKRVLRMLSNGVYVLTSRSAEHYGAATVTWVSQASFKPPLLMAAVRRESNVYQCAAASGSAALHVVGEGQQEIARRFFYPTCPGSGTLNGEPFREGRTTSPVLANLPAHVECHVEQIVDTDGDHAVLILRVVEAECSEHQGERALSKFSCCDNTVVRKAGHSTTILVQRCARQRDEADAAWIYRR